MKTWNRNTKLGALAALVVLTVAAGVATRGQGTEIAHVPPPGGTTFTANQTHPVSFTGRLDRSRVLRGSDGLVRMELAIGGEQREAIAVRMPTDLVVVLDRSGSMEGEKLRYARAAITELIAQLESEDRFALISYSDYAAHSIPLTRAGDGARDSWHRIVSGIGASGSTNLSHGLELALQTIAGARDSGRVPRVILISDGLANRGDASFSGLVARARRAAHGEYMLSTIGVGEDFNEELMTALADAGTGNYYYLQSAQNLALVFAAEFDSARSTVATGLALQIDPGPGVRVVSAAGYPLERTGNGVVIRPGALFSGQERRIWVTFEAPSSAVGDYTLGRFSLAYSDAGSRREISFASLPTVACVEDRERFLGGLDKQLWERSVAEETYGLMQKKVSDYVRQGRLDEARSAIEGFATENEALNKDMDSKLVEEQIHRAEELKREVDDAFVGADAPAKRNRLSKEKGLESQSLRRKGAYSVAPESVMKDPSAGETGGSR